MATRFDRPWYLKMLNQINYLSILELCTKQCKSVNVTSQASEHSLRYFLILKSWVNKKRKFHDSLEYLLPNWPSAPLNPYICTSYNSYVQYIIVMYKFWSKVQNTMVLFKLFDKISPRFTFKEFSLFQQRAELIIFPTFSKFSHVTLNQLN